MEEWKNFRLRTLVRHAYATVPYYRRVMRSLGLTPSDIRTTQDLERMPILTKRAIRRNFQDMISHGYPTERMAVDHTSGSTGEPLTFYRTLYQESWGRAADRRARALYGVRPGIRWALTLPVSPDNHTRRTIQLLMQRGMLFNTMNTSAETLGWFARRLRNTKTRLLRGTPTALYVLARFVEEHDYGLALDLALSQGETLFPHMREQIERTFGCRLFDLYGATEVGSIAAQCPDCGLYLVSDETVHLELLQHEGDQLGDVVVTSLTNFGMPFIRYALGDVASGFGGNCDCGRARTTLRSIEGQSATLVARRGGRFMATIFSGPVEDMPIERYSVVQVDYDSFRFFVVPEEGFGPEHRETMTRRMRTLLGNVDVEILEVERIPPLPGGKHRYVVSEVRYKPAWLEASKKVPSRRDPAPHHHEKRGS